MECPRCHSLRIVKFVDGTGSKRVFCRDCWLSTPERIVHDLNGQKRLPEFSRYYIHNYPKMIV